GGGGSKGQAGGRIANFLWLYYILSTGKSFTVRVDKKSPGGVNRRMNYTRQFRQLREAKNLSREQLAALAGCHRNTVINIETGRPVKFSTIADLLQKMGHARESPEM